MLSHVACAHSPTHTRNPAGSFCAAAEQVKGAVRVAAKVLGRMETQGVSPNAVTCTAALEVGVYVVLRSPIDSPAHKLGAALCENIIGQMQNLPQMLGDGHTRRDMTYALNLVLRALSRQLGAVRQGERAVLDVIELLLMEGAVCYKTARTCYLSQNYHCVCTAHSPVVMTA